MSIFTIILVLLAIFVGLAIAAIVRFHPELRIESGDPVATYNTPQ